MRLLSVVGTDFVSAFLHPPERRALTANAVARAACQAFFAVCEGPRCRQESGHVIAFAKQRGVVMCGNGWNNDFLTGHITRINSNLYRAFIEAEGMKRKSRDMTPTQYELMVERMEDASSSPQIEFDFNSIWPLLRFVQFEEDLVLENA